MSPQHAVIEGVRFPSFGSHMKEIYSNSMSKLYFYEENVFWSDVEKAWNMYPQHPAIEGVRFLPFGFHMKDICSNSL